MKISKSIIKNTPVEPNNNSVSDFQLKQLALMPSQKSSYWDDVNGEISEVSSYKTNIKTGDRVEVNRRRNETHYFNN